MGHFTVAEFPAQTKNRHQWIIETVRENQVETWKVLSFCLMENYKEARNLLLTMHKQDRDALLIENGILTNEQIDRIRKRNY